MDGSVRADDPMRSYAYDEFVRESIALIPAYAPAWTNHNASDPGITLVELFAYFSEILAYRALRITPDAKLNLLRLLEGPDGDAQTLHGQPSARLDAAIRARVQALLHTQCAVTPADFERAALEAAGRHLGTRDVVRAHAVAGVDLRHGAAVRDGGDAAETAGDVSVIVAPEREPAPDALERLCDAVQQELATRCLLTTHVHVIGPVYLHVYVGCRLALEDATGPAEAIGAIEAALRARFGPAEPGEPVAHARPFGRSLFLSEVTEVIDGAAGVDWVDEVSVHRLSERRDDASDAWVGLRVGIVATLGADARLGGMASTTTRRLLRDAHGEVVAVRLYPWELVRVNLAPEALVPIDRDDGGFSTGAAHGGWRGAPT